MAQNDETRTCFVMMPFGKKKVGEKEIDFNFIYDEVFVPAIKATALPEGGTLEPKRTDKDFFSSDISIDMFHYLEYSRFALADISGLNANVFYELGVRHRAHQAGTALFRQLGCPIPFDITSVKAFDYDFEPIEHVQKSRQLITTVLSESLKYNRLDSPVQIALAAQRALATSTPGPQNIDNVLREAENAIRLQDWITVIAKYREALTADPTNFALRVKLGLFLKDRGRWQEALDQFRRAVQACSTYADAYREMGIVENKIYIKEGQPPDQPTGEASLLHAIELAPEDYDAWASLGGILKRQERFDEALQVYRQATAVSWGHSYPLLNELILQGRMTGHLNLNEDYQFHLTRAERGLRLQIAENPPINAPWSFFDLSTILLLAERKAEALAILNEGLLTCTASWQPKTHRKTLQLLKDGNVALTGLEGAIAGLEKAERRLPGS